MDKRAKIYVAGHRGLVGSAIVRNLRAKGYDNLLLRTHAELDLTEQQATEAFFAAEKPEYVFLAAAKVGGILANNTYPAEFIRDNLAIQTNVIEAAHRNDARRLLFLGSSCIYPRDCPQPIKEEYLLTGPLEPTNRPYALAKIAGIEMCWSYNRQYGTKYLSVMPTNLYGPGDNYDLNGSHVIPALIRKFHEAKVSGANEVIVWGTGKPRREFLYSDDMAAACVYLMTQSDAEFDGLLASFGDRAPLINIGTGDDMTVAELAGAVAKVVGYDGKVVFDTSKPDGTMRKLLDVSFMTRRGWKAGIGITDGLRKSYESFLSDTRARGNAGAASSREG